MLGWKCKELENDSDFVVPLMAVSPNVLGNVLFSFLELKNKITDICVVYALKIPENYTGIKNRQFAN